MVATPRQETILMAFDTIESGFEALSERFTLIRPPHGRDFTRDEIIEKAASATILCSVFDIPIDREIIDHAPHLKLIANYAVGFNNIDIEYCREKGIAVANTPESVIAPTAELALALLLSASRRTAEWDRSLRSNGRDLKISRLDNLGIDLLGKTIGIVGFGNIGRAVAKRCQAFGMQVLYYKRARLPEAIEKELNVCYQPLDELFQQADVISLHTPLNADSKHLVNARRIQLMKPSALLINTARGAVVDENALIHALENHQIAGAALDVFEDADKPHPRLLELPNVVMTPHVGTQTYDARLAMALELTNNILGFVDGDRPVAYVVK